jgi:hypothetical protein
VRCVARPICDQNRLPDLVVMGFVWRACLGTAAGWHGAASAVSGVLHSFHLNWNASLGLGGSRIPVLEECMKPAIETPSGVSTDPYSKTVCCLRCEQKLQRYQLMRASLAPGNVGHAILSCPRCGHVEFVADSSPLLQSLELVTVDTGDGD